MVAPNPPAARRRTNPSSCSVAVPSSWEESVVSGAIANRFAISRPHLNLSGDQTTIDQTSDIPQAGRHRVEARSLQLDKVFPEQFPVSSNHCRSLVSWFEMREDVLLPSPRKAVG